MQLIRLFILSISLLILTAPGYTLADHNKEKHTQKYMKPVTNQTYKTECGACHFAYQPELLPSRSWDIILNKLPAHFGEEVLLEEVSRKDISGYLSANAAENSSAKRARKIVKSLGGETPLRITEIPYIREKHHDLDKQVFSSKFNVSFSNCSACHTGAEQGDYDDDNVRIPR